MQHGGSPGEDEEMLRVVRAEIWLRRFNDDDARILRGKFAGRGNPGHTRANDRDIAFPGSGAAFGATAISIQSDFLRRSTISSIAKPD
jgi:hypothetical protein